jgi:excisionase family DNA binding protein
VRHRIRNPEEWSVLIKDHHEGYIDWNMFQNNQIILANNDDAHRPATRGSVRRGTGLLSGLLRCGHCGVKLIVQYPRPDVIRYQCPGYILNHEIACCVMFGGGAADTMVSEQVLACLQPLGMQAAIKAADNLQNMRDDRAHQKELALKQAQYDVRHARLQYDEVDPSNRLVAAELERRWNEALKRQAQLEDELASLQREASPLNEESRTELLAIGQDIRRLWEHPECSPEYKKRILRAVLKDIIVRSEDGKVHLVLHWQGGDHTELSFMKKQTGQHRYGTAPETVDLVRSLARMQPDSMIASILNRMGRSTAHGESWTTKRVCALRHYQGIDAYREGERQSRGEMTLREVADLLRVPERTALYMIHQKKLPATQVCKNAPWVVRKSDVDLFLASHRDRPPQENEDQPMLSFQ